MTVGELEVVEKPAARLAVFCFSVLAQFSFSLGFAFSIQKQRKVGAELLLIPANARTIYILRENNQKDRGLAENSDAQEVELVELAYCGVQIASLPRGIHVNAS